jgi:hypothetical protein
MHFPSWRFTVREILRNQCGAVLGRMLDFGAVVPTAAFHGVPVMRARRWNQEMNANDRDEDGPRHANEPS